MNDHEVDLTVNWPAPAPPSPKPDPDDAAYEKDLEADRGLHTAYFETIFDVAKDGRARSLEAAKYIQVAAGAIGTLYTGALALVFSASDKPLPLRGLLTPLFLGLSVVLSATYLGFISYRKVSVPMPIPTDSLPQQQLDRANHLIQWIGEGTRRTAWAMRSAVLALGVGLAFLPAAFVTGVPPTAGAPSAPAIPTEIADEVADTSIRIFERQAAAFLDPAAAPAVGKLCTDERPQVFYECGWRTTDNVNHRFLELGLVGAAVVALPMVWATFVWTRRTRFAKWLDSTRMHKIQSLSAEVKRLEQENDDLRGGNGARSV